MKFRGKMTETMCMRQFASKCDLQGVLFGSLCSHNLWSLFVRIVFKDWNWLWNVRWIICGLKVYLCAEITVRVVGGNNCSSLDTAGYKTNLSQFFISAAIV